MHLISLLPCTHGLQLFLALIIKHEIFDLLRSFNVKHKVNEMQLKVQFEISNAFSMSVSVSRSHNNSNFNFPLHLNILADRHEIIVGWRILNGLLHLGLHGGDGVLLPAHSDRSPMVVHLGLVAPQRVLEEVRREMHF